MKKLIFLLTPPLILLFYRKLKFSLLQKSIKRELLKRIQIIRNFNLESLSNSNYIENNILPGLGLNCTTSYNFEIFPQTLSKYINVGLRIWQYPNQFAPFLMEISKLRIENYLEIGMEHGGSFITIMEFLNRVNHNTKGLGVDFRLSDKLKIYQSINKNVDLYEMDSHSPEFKNLLDKQNSLDLVFIDGDHSRYGVELDFNLVKGKAKYIAFHDIVDFNCNGVRDFWNELKISYKADYDFKEYIEQYSEIKNKTGKGFLGIGFMIKKEVTS